MTILTALPSPPSLSDSQATFDNKASAFLTAIQLLVTQINSGMGGTTANQTLTNSTIGLNPGTVAAPTLSFQNGAGTGLYNIGVNHDGYSVNGVKMMDIAATGLTFSGQTAFAAGSVAAPGVTLGNGLSTGLYNIGTNNDGYSINGVKLLDMAAGALGITGSLSVSGLIYASGGIIVNGVSNTIGTPGQQGFGVGICPSPPPGMAQMYGCMDLGSDNYGNYQYSDGSVMVWIPAFFYKWGTGANGFAINQVDIKPRSAYSTVALANAAGYALHRAFTDGGVEQTGFFVDKYLASNNAGTASSIRNANVITSAQRGSLTTATFASLTGAPANFYYGAIAAAKTRGSNFFCSSRFIFAALAMLSYAHAQASSSTTYCAWYNATNNFPKGCNNNALGDAQDGSILYLNDGNGTYNCGKTGSANLFARTTHNGMNFGVCDLNGLVWEITPGMATDTAATTYYALKTTAAMKNVTGSNTLATDLWGATGLAALYDSLGTTYGAAAASSTAKLYGSASQVFSEATSGNAWNFTGLGGPLVAGVGGTNAFGNDGFWDYRPADMCPVSGGAWYASSSAGFWAFHLSNVRSYSSYDVGFRAALYL